MPADERYRLPKLHEMTIERNGVIVRAFITDRTAQDAFEQGFNWSGLLHEMLVEASRKALLR